MDRKKSTALLVVFFAAAFFVSAALFYDRPSNELIVAFLDIGQGDAIFIRTPSGRQVLIDGGPDRSVLARLGTVMPFFDRTIDVIINTHPDKDHVGGLPYVFERYTVGNVLDPGLETDTAIYDFYEERLAAEHAVYREARRGDVIDFGDGAYIRVLFPDRNMDGVSDDNKASVITQIVYGETEVMLTGDSPQAIERYVVSLDGLTSSPQAATLESDILKAGHHGSRTSTSQEFLDAVNPDYAIISAGKDNSYGHPHKEVIERLIAASTTILSTAELGTIIFESDGKVFTRLE